MNSKPTPNRGDKSRFRNMGIRKKSARKKGHFENFFQALYFLLYPFIRNAFKLSLENFFSDFFKKNEKKLVTFSYRSVVIYNGNDKMIENHTQKRVSNRVKKTESKQNIYVMKFNSGGNIQNRTDVKECKPHARIFMHAALECKTFSLDVMLGGEDFISDASDSRAYEATVRTNGEDCMSAALDCKADALNCKACEATVRTNEGNFMSAALDCNADALNCKAYEATVRTNEENFMPDALKCKTLTLDFGSGEEEYGTDASNFKSDEEDFSINEQDSGTDEEDFKAHEAKFRTNEDNSVTVEGGFKANGLVIKAKEVDIRTYELVCSTNEGLCGECLKKFIMIGGNVQLSVSF